MQLINWAYWLKALYRCLKNGRFRVQPPPRRLSLNSSKTQLIWFGTRQVLQKLGFTLLTEHFPSFYSLIVYVAIGVIMDVLILSLNIINLTRSFYYQLRSLKAIRRCVSTSTMTAIISCLCLY